MRYRGVGAREAYDSIQEGIDEVEAGVDRWHAANDIVQGAYNLSEAVQGRNPEFYSIVPEYLEPIGDSGFFVTPNEPADPQDCDRYPDSPWCGGTGFDPLDLSPAALEPTFETNGCETCVTISSSILGIQLAPYTVCYRLPIPGCRPTLPPEQPPEPTPEPFQGPPIWFPWRNFDPTDKCAYIIYWTWKTYDRYGNEFTIAKDLGTGANIGSIGQPLGHYAALNYRPETDDFGNYTGNDIPTYWTIWYAYVEVDRSVTLLRKIEMGNGNFGAPQIAEVYKLPPEAQTAECAPSTYRPTLPPPYPTESMACNCYESEELLRLIARRLGTADYPVSLPKSLVEDNQATEQQQSLTQLLFWTIKQMDALIGQFPIAIQIEDIDPTQEGNQTREISLKNVAESIAELFAMQVKTTVNSDVSIEFLMRLASEMLMTKNAVLVTQDYAKANASYLGYKGNPKKRTINYAFDIFNLTSLDKILKDSERSIIGWQDEDKNTVQSYLEKLMFAAGIIKAVYFRPGSNTNKLIDELGRYLGINPDLTPEQREEERDLKWRQFLDALNNENGGFNRNSPITPNVYDPQIALEDFIRNNWQAPGGEGNNSSSSGGGS